MATNPILITGAGPSGLVLALSLAKHGVPVRVIDKEPIPRLGERGSGIMPRSFELHKLLGTLPDYLKAAKPAPLTRQYDPTDGHKIVKTSALVPVLEPTPQIPFINPLMLGQCHQEAIYRSHLEKVGVLSNLIARQVDGKEIIEEMKTPWLIGTDGARSVVRKTLGLDFLGETRDGDDIFMGDIRIKGEQRQFWDRWGSPATKMTFLRPSGRDDGVLQFLIAGRNVDLSKIMESRETIIEEFYEISGRRDIIFEDLIWTSRYRQVSMEVRVGRVLVGGDAAHVHSPVGAQGLNSSIQDSFNLGWKLALVQKGYAPSSLLNTYAEERLPVIAEMLGKTTELLNQVMNTGGDARRGGDMGQLGVNYRGSSIVYEDDVEVATVKGVSYNADSETAARPGDRAVGAPGLIDTQDEDKIVTLHDILSPSRHTILVFGIADADHSGLSEVIKKYPAGTIRTVLMLPKGTEATSSANAAGLFDQVLVDGEGHAYSGYHVTELSIAVIRPDGVVGARVRGATGVEKYLKGIFL
ncbi:hypothetical protein GALMADRAFT_135956 [Galerina marginata CBS 339.88]|uniref:FAD-binding domain-containing protein n=1 Tax=Galerina marginata (strain CBS 339.88) TaxID=685588 RepID=A0A067TLT3_GALM3|nr:hypothetical protein GALMADRAFT_135956 [Galerina marginata CBS 339.88]